MTLIRKLASALYLALLSANYSNAQEISTTGNLINSGTSATDTTSVWNNGVYVNQLCFYAGMPGNCGPNPSIRPGGAINFSYGTTDLNQVININNALSSAGTGIQLAGFTYSLTAKNGNGWDDGRQDYLAAYVKLYGSGGNLIANYDYSATTNQRYNWTTFNFNEIFATSYIASSLSTAQVGMIGRDNNFWAGNYGPEVINVDFRLKYKTDPCATNPAYSSTCAGFDKVVNTNNLLDSSVGGTTLNQAFAINTALQNAGIGATIHGFNYGFNYRVGESWSGCTATNQDGSCSWYMNIPANAKATVSLTNSSNQSLYSKNYNFVGDGTSGSVSEKFLLPTSLNQAALGTGRITGTAQGTNSSIEGAWATMIYTADPCSTNPLYSPDCKGYAAAIAKQVTASTSTTSTAPYDPANPASVETTTIALAPTTSGSPPPPGSTPPPGSPPPPDASGSQPQSQQQPPPATASAPPPGTPTTSAAPTANNPQPKPGEVQTAGANKSTSSGSSSSSGPSALAMSVVASVQAKVSATEKATVQQANEAAATATAQAVQTAESVAGTAQANSIASSTSSTTTTSSSTTRSTTSTQTSVGGFSLQGNTQTSVVTFSALKPNTPATDTLDSSNSSSSENNNLDALKNNSNSSIQTAMAQQPQVVVQPLQAPQQDSQQVAQAQQQTQQPLQAPQQEQQKVVQQIQQTQQPLQAPQQEQPQTVVLVQQTQQPLQAPQQEQSQPVMIAQQAQQPLQAPQQAQPQQVVQVQQQTEQPLQMPQQEQPQTATVYQAPVVVAQPVVSYSLTEPSNFNFDTVKKQEVAPVTEVEIPKTDTFKMGTKSTLNDYISEQPFMSLMGMEPTQDGMVKRNVQPNEAAGGVDIASIATQPKGYDAYAQMTLKDASFYKVEDIYKGQRNVDNVRLLRGLTSGSDRLHQSMVDQQYKLGN